MPPSKKPRVYVNAKTQENFQILQSYTDVIKSIAFAGTITLLQDTPAPEGCATNVVNTNLEVYVDIRELIDIDAEIARLEAKKTNLTTQKETLLKKVNHPSYGKVPENVRNDNAQKVIFTPLFGSA